VNFWRFPSVRAIFDANHHLNAKRIRPRRGYAVARAREGVRVIQGLSSGEP
jgi:hypothetical protein